MPNYRDGKIYSIRSHQTDKIYVGSTTQSLAKRIYDHRAKYLSFNKNKGCYISSYEVLKYEDNYIELIEDYPCSNKNELHRREGEIIRLSNCVNKNIAGRRVKELYNDNKQVYATKAKKYRETHKDKLKVKSRLYYISHKEERKEYDKKYKDERKEKRKEEGRLYRLENSSSIKERKNKKTDCDCGGKYTESHKALHFRTNKHIKYIEGLYDIEDIQKLYIL